MLQKMSHEQWSEVIRTNLDSLFNMTRPIINAMRERGFGASSTSPRSTGRRGSLG
jgi:acetoacetyl-CoA reductase